MNKRDLMVGVAGATVFVATLKGLAPELAYAYGKATSPTIDVAAGKTALGDFLPLKVSEQVDSVVSIETEDVPRYNNLDGTMHRGSNETLFGSGVALPMTENGQRLIATAGHVGMRPQSREYNCAEQIISLFTNKQKSYEQEVATAGAGTLTASRDMGLITAPGVSYSTINAIEDNPLEGMKTGEPIYSIGFSATNAAGEHIERSPSNILSLGNLANSPKDDAHAAIVGGLAVTLSKDSKRLTVLTSLGKSYGPDYNDQVYPGDSGGAAFDQNGKFIGVVTNTSEPMNAKEITTFYGVNLEHAENQKYQIEYINVVTKDDIANMEAALKPCPDTPDPILNDKK